MVRWGVGSGAVCCAWPALSCHLYKGTPWKHGQCRGIALVGDSALLLKLMLQKCRCCAVVTRLWLCAVLVQEQALQADPRAFETAQALARLLQGPFGMGTLSALAFGLGAPGAPGGGGNRPVAQPRAVGRFSGPLRAGSGGAAGVVGPSPRLSSSGSSSGTNTTTSSKSSSSKGPASSGSSTGPNTQAQRGCAWCGAAEASLLACARCLSAAYYSRECQVGLV